MKKLIKLVFCLVALFSCFLINVEAATYTEEQVIENLAYAEEDAKEIINDLKTWADSYADTVDSVLTQEVLDALTVENYAADINLIINKLKDAGHNDAANALDSIKLKLIENIDSLKEKIKMAEVYLSENVSGGVQGSLDLFIEIRKMAKNIKEPLGDYLDVFYTKAYNKVSNEIDSATNHEEFINALDKMIEKIDTMDSLVNKIENKLFDWQEIYNDYYLVDYEDLIQGYVQDYYNRLREDYNKLYKKIETKLQNKLDEKIKEIVDNTDYDVLDELIKANDDLVDIALVIEDVISEVYDLYYTLGEKVEIDKVLEISEDYFKQIVTRLEQARDYVLSYVVSDVLVRDEDKTPYITIDRENKLIIYGDTKLNADEVLAKFTSVYGDLGFAYIYENGTDYRLGTNSVIYNFKDLMVFKEYTLVVRGDIAPSGSFDITDVVKLCNKLFETEELDQYQLLAADLDGNSKIDITDVVMLCNILFG